ncbi:hypothetical protein RUA4292_00844 [Ruegeria atlantica]|uniref:Uncharacterized protein n=1 Tax=Ruegeria atlantica TaxID=81569 RepID=A0A0P1EC66_9RHOB|nr:hypothetical protein RUA4292_00844 [Ruegeria atlantica]
MLRLNVLALFPEFALAFACDFIRSSHVIVGPDSQRNIFPPTKPPAGSFGKGSHRNAVCSVGCPNARASNNRIRSNCNKTGIEIGRRDKRRKQTPIELESFSGLLRGRLYHQSGVAGLKLTVGKSIAHLIRLLRMSRSNRLPSEKSLSIKGSRIERIWHAVFGVPHIHWCSRNRCEF